MQRQWWQNQNVFLIILVGDKAIRILRYPTGPHWTPWETQSPCVSLLNHKCPVGGA